MEMVFAPKAGANDVKSDDGYIIGFIHDERTEQSFFLVLDALDLSVVAKARVPRRVPYGFHGIWVPS